MQKNKYQQEKITNMYDKFTTQLPLVADAIAWVSNVTKNCWIEIFSAANNKILIGIKQEA